LNRSGAITSAFTFGHGWMDVQGTFSITESRPTMGFFAMEIACRHNNRSAEKIHKFVHLADLYYSSFRLIFFTDLPRARF
jgi:hypothetical protein